MMIDGFALWSVGDGVHDPNNMSLQVGTNTTGPWRTIASFQGTANVSTVQTFDFAGIFANFFRLIIHNRHSGLQSYVQEVQLRAALSTPVGYLPNLATSKNDSSVVSSTGAEEGCDAWKAADGKIAFRAVAPGGINQFVGEGWNAAGTDDKGGLYLVFDLKTQTEIIGFAMYSAGDVTHDPDECRLQALMGPYWGVNWTTIATFRGQAGFDGLQEFSGFKATSRYWRFYIASTHVPRYQQAFVKVSEILLRRS